MKARARALQNITGSDGIGDKYYKVQNDYDRYPLMAPFRSDNSKSINYSKMRTTDPIQRFHDTVPQVRH